MGTSLVILGGVAAVAGAAALVLDNEDEIKGAANDVAQGTEQVANQVAQGTEKVANQISKGFNSIFN